MSKEFTASQEAIDESTADSASAATMSTHEEQDFSATETQLHPRRKFLAQAGLTGLGVLGAGSLLATPANAGEVGGQFFFNRLPIFRRPVAPTNPAPSASDFDILNFALNLEYLEAEYYLRAAFGRGLADSDTTGTGTRGDVIGGSAVPFATQAIREYAEEIARDEEAHVKLLRRVLGSRAVARPTIDLQQSFTNAARAAGLIGPNETFNPFENEDTFLLGAFIFEDVGVTAYKGAAPLIQNKDILAAAAGLLGVEAYHAGEIRTILFAKGLEEPAQAISDLRDSVDGPTDIDQGIVLNGRANIVPTDADGLVFSRTPRQVLNIVYLSGANPSSGGFFPNGLNGNIR